MYRYQLKRTHLIKIFAVATVAVALIQTSGIISAQDFDRYRPNPPLQQPTYPELPAPADTPIKGSTEVVIPELKGVMIVGDESHVQDPIEAFTGLRIDSAADVTVARHAEFEHLIRSYLGQPISIRTLNEMARNIVLLYRDCKQPVVDVSMPPGQDITDGVVQIVITEARIGDIRFEGACWFDNCLLQQQSWLRPGQRIYEPCLQKELVWYNQNPFRDVGVELEPGSIPGTTDIVFNVEDERPLRGYIGYEDSGTRVTGLERVNAGFVWGNAFGRDRQLSYQYTTDADLSDTIGVHSFVYQVPVFENRDTWTVFGSWADVDALINIAPGTQIRSSGSSWQVSGRYRHVLCQTKCQLDQLQFGFDVKGSDNFADFGIIPGGGTNASSLQIVQLTAGLSSQQRHADGSTTYAVDAFASPGGLLARNDNENFNSVRPGARSAYAYARGYIERLYDVDCRSDFVVRLTGQLATSKLVPIEQLGFGGYNTIRGYDMRSLNGDNGGILNLEYRSKPIHRCCRGKQSSLTLLAFSDMGHQFNWGGDPNLSDNEFLASAGVGFRYLIDPTCSIRFDYGVPIVSLAGQNFNEQGRVHLGATIAY